MIVDMITSQQSKHFEAFGFIVVRQLFSPDEIATVTDEFEAAMLKAREGQPVNEETRQQVDNWFEGRPRVDFLTNDYRILGLVEALLGPDYSLSKSNDGNLYVGNTLWHPDLGWDPHIPEGKNDPGRAKGQYRNHYVPSIKVAFYLDSVDKQTGCLRVIPGAHRSPYHEQFWSLHPNCPSAASESQELQDKLSAMWERETGSAEHTELFLSDPGMNHFGLDQADIPNFPIKSQPGDAVFFSHQLWHSSFGGRAGRRMFTLNFKSAQADSAG